jgi:hypothetical protein
MNSMFAASMAKLAILGQNRADLVDCSEVLPPPAAPVTKPPTFPATKSNKDIEQACEGTPFPTLSTDRECSHRFESALADRDCFSWTSYHHSSLPRRS